ncbi:MAG TPA: cupin domain-containing protein [Gaiellaceae bacterium]|jgi:quercetin dioxygenase-like cupin family protein|nr:cupin domain-containing protein [Gaiellaceae bacterium]
MSSVFRYADLPRADRGGNVSTTYLVAGRADQPPFTTGITEFAPGAALPLHHHNCDESVVVIEGAAVYQEGATDLELRAYDTTLVPAGVVHCFRNESEDVMKILWIYGSATPTRTLHDTGETFPIGSEPHGAQS